MLAALTGEVLEIGGGTGANLPHYPRTVERVVVTEPDPFMRARLEWKLDAAVVPVELVAAPAEELPVREASIDAVVSTLVLCSVAELEASLAEVARVLRPGGRLVFIEHVRAEGKRARWQDRVQPLWGRLAAGCHLNRDTLGAISAAGFELETLERFAAPAPLPRLLPHVQGAARRAP